MDVSRCRPLVAADEGEEGCPAREETGEAEGVAGQFSRIRRSVRLRREERESHKTI